MDTEIAKVKNRGLAACEEMWGADRPRRRREGGEHPSASWSLCTRAAGEEHERDMTRFVAAAAARVALRVASALEERASTSGASLVGRLGPGGASRSAVSTRLPPTLAATGRVWYSKEAGGSDEGAESGGAGESPRGAAQAKAGKEEEEEQQQQQQPEGGEPAFVGYAKRFSSMVREELKDMFDMKESDVSATRRRPEYKHEEYTGTTDVAVSAEPEKTGWEKRWDEVKDQAKTTAFFQKVTGLKEHKLVQRANEVAEDMRDRWETSDSAFVHKIQDSLQETEFAAATREIRARDPNFDMVEFLRDVRRDILPVMDAYLKGNMDVLKEHCSSEVCERVEAQQKFLKQEGAVMDSRILDIKEVHLFDVKSFENSPLVIVRFALQQIKCVRDKYGNILEGAADEIQAVDYLWALQQDSAGAYEGGRFLPPRWILRECQGIQEMKQIV